MIISVNSFQEAEKYPVLFGTSEIMLDNNRDIFYVKSVDNTGRYVMSTYEFRQVENEKPLTADNFVTREQFNMMNNKIDLLLAQLSATPPNPTFVPQDMPVPIQQSEQLTQVNTGGGVNEQRVPQQPTQRRANARSSGSAQSGQSSATAE